MNERIGKLVEQAEEWVCKNYPDAMDDNDEFHAQTMEKLAELIIEACNQYALRNWEHGHLLGQDLKIYFGVEE